MNVEGKTSTEILEEIAKEHLDIDTLKTRNSDGLDFQEVAVWNIQAALYEALMAGVQMGAMIEQANQKEQG